MRTTGPSAILGGPVGRRASARAWAPPPAWSYALATVAWFVCMARQVPCVMDPATPYRVGCYSDIQSLWGPRGIEQGLVPYLQVDLEYPVLTGGFIWGTRLLSGALPGGAEGGRLAFFGLSALGLFVAFLALVAVHVRIAPRTAPWVAASPLVVLSGLINWDLLAVAVTSGALLAWARRRPALAGVLVGIGLSTKFYPALLLLPFVVLSLRAGDLRALARVVLGAVAAFVAVNLPVMVAAPQGWLNIWTYHAGRDADLGSVWYVLGLAQVTLPAAALSRALFVTGVLAIVVLCFLAPRRPRVAQVTFLVVVVFCVTNVVYSPQYMLWLLPLVLLARPRWVDGVAFTLAEAFYWWAVWMYLDGSLYAGDGAPRLYGIAVLVRIGVQLWLAARVVVDVLHPWDDPVRLGHVDDPGGGVLDHAPDAVALAARRPGW
ncbi:glycosyltransferase 87 family protein [Propioniciclava sp.]|uniref:glycosyltransferase family 87 protein n=1 Tax=Propioniciclava sp. TaxID=2038686 RepID=UPI00263279C2|nr:glycosyltransferase 87 family protein [Propioniciclava sp.]